MDNIVLIGSEEVSKAGYNMLNAAREISQAASYIESSLLDHRRYMDEWLIRFGEMLKQPPSGQEG